MRDASGSWRSAGWTYEVVSNYVKSIWRSELATPGGYRRKIKAYRDAVRAAPPMPAGSTIRVTTKTDDEPYVTARFKEFAANHPVIPLADGFTAPITPENADDLSRLNRRSTEFFLPSAAPTRQPADLFSGA